MSSDIKRITKCMYKYEIAALCCVSMSTFKKWLYMYDTELKKLDYKPNQKILTPAQINFLNSKLDFL